MLPLTDLFTLFISGGPAGMITITLLFIGLFFAAWKAPRWVKEIGIGALVVGMKKSDVIARLEGIDCKGRGTSCPDQLARALKML